MLFTSGVAGSPEVIAAVRAVARTFGWGDGAQWDALQQLVSHESGFNPNAANPTSSARGLFQKLTSVNGPIEPTIQGQTQWGLNYIAGRYGTPLAAWSAWQSRNPHWYDAGGLANGVGLMPKNVIEPERVLSPPQTRAFEAAMARIGRTGYERADLDGTTAPTVVHQTINPSPGMDETDVGRAAGRFVVHSLRKI
ncbi:aggregation-promoting factor C-terminal-like domain-containing protein [Amycolatopsis sp. NPDC004368]